MTQHETNLWWKKKSPGPFFIESQLTTKDTLTRAKEHFSGRKSKKRTSCENGKRNNVKIDDKLRETLTLGVLVRC